MEYPLGLLEGGLLKFVAQGWWIIPRGLIRWGGQMRGFTAQKHSSLFTISKLSQDFLSKTF